MKSLTDSAAPVEDQEVRIEPVYDLINVGERRRFWANGKLVHNSDGINVQNLPSGRKAGQSKALRRAIQAPQDWSVVVCDSSQIEARANAYMSNEHWLLEVFASGGDPYSVQASQLYGGDPAEIKKRAKSGEREYEIKRSIGKVAILSAQYGVGWKSFQAMCKVQGGIDVSDDDAKHIINVYRKTNPNIVKFWDTCKYVLERMAVGAAGYFGGPNNDLFYYDGGRKVHGKTVPSIQLPDGNWLCYYNLQKKMRQYDDGSEKLNFCYWGVKERKPQTVWIYPAKLAENLCQAFAFAVMKQQALLINKWAPIRMNVHDEWGICVPKEYAKAGLDYMLACMRWAPAWAQGLPLNAEGDYSDRYGDCK